MKENNGTRIDNILLLASEEVESDIRSLKNLYNIRLYDAKLIKETYFIISCIILL